VYQCCNSVGWLTYDTDNEFLEPHVRNERLKDLGLFTSTNADGAEFDALMLTYIDLNKLQENRYMRAAYLMRYGRQSYKDIQDMPVDEIWELVKHIGEFIKKESPIDKNNDTD
jgi:hypothetical protein